MVASVVAVARPQNRHPTRIVRARVEGVCMTDHVSHTTPEMRAKARGLDGLYAGSLRPEEYGPLVDAGLLRFTYEGTGGLMGLAKLRATERAWISCNHRIGLPNSGGREPPL